MELLLKRAYLPASPTDGYRVLVDRLWPRGLSRQEAKLDEWNKDLAPSTALRQWFGHDPARWKTFGERYLAELRASDACQTFLDKVQQQERVTLVYPRAKGLPRGTDAPGCSPRQAIAPLVAESSPYAYLLQHNRYIRYGYQRRAAAPPRE